MNLMDLMKDQVFSQMAGKLGTHLGESEQATKSGLDALLPTVLGGLVKQASNPGGADALAKTLDQDDFDGGLLDNFGDMLSGGDVSPVSNLSGSLLSMLFGDKVSAIVGLISKVTGMGGKSTSSLLGLALPLIMSFLGKQKRSQGLDVGGLTDLLMGQKNHIASALPAGIADEMGLGALGIASPSASAPAPSASANRSGAQPQAGGGGLMKLLIPLVIIGLLCLLGYKLFGGGETAELPEVPAVPGVDVDLGSVEIPELGAATEKLTGSFTGLTDIFGGITDADSATASLDKLKEADLGLGKITSSLESAPEGLKGGLMKAAAGLIPGLTETIDKVMAIPGVGAILQPVVDSLKEKFGMLSA